MENREIHRLEMKSIGYRYGRKENSRFILQNATYIFESGKMYAILGKSGVGKSTTLALLGSLDLPQEGEILYDGRNIREIGFEKYRKHVVSIVFQDYNLLPYLNGYENVALVTKKKYGRQKIEGFLKAVGIDEKTARRNVRKLSGGEQQRIAMARALAMDSKMILADEPTGNLDLETADEIIEILFRLAHDDGKCVIVVTHTLVLAERADVVLKLKEGRLEEQS